MKRISILVTGKVQGVFYRKSTREMAMQLGLKGYVMNKPDGSVYIEAEGDPADLTKLVNWCHTGPVQAEVTDVKVTDLIPEGSHGFEVRRTS